LGSRDHVFDVVVDMLNTAAGECGALLVVDDLHWADVPSIRLLQAIPSRSTDTRLLAVGLYRGREAYPYPELADGLGAIRRERGTTVLRLGGLTPDEVADLVARRLGRRPDDAFLRLVERAEGNPLFAEVDVFFCPTVFTADFPHAEHHTITTRQGERLL
jgi:predicted ATPase